MSSSNQASMMIETEKDEAAPMAENAAVAVSRMSSNEAYRRNLQRRRQQAGQSAIVAIIVLFLLLFLAGIFIGIIAGNIKNAQRSASNSASGRYSEAGLKYLDEQLTKSPEGADWRPVPDCAYGTVPCASIGTNDPDYNWLRPCGPNQAEPCGFTRVNFGGPTPTQGSSGGRALVKITYRPPLPGETFSSQADPLRRYLRLEAVGRSGQVFPDDPTTYKNTDALGQRVELLAYKAINLNEYTIQVTNKNNKPGAVPLGPPFPVRDRGVIRQVENIIFGPVRINAGLTFYGVNRLYMNPVRNEALEVAGGIFLNGVPDNALAVSNVDPTQVYVNTTGLATNLNPNQPNVLPSGSQNFTTLGPQLAALIGTAAMGLVRDNPRGAETLTLPTSFDAYGNQYQNLRSVPRVTPPTIDEPIGMNGTTRYKELTQNSPPLAPRYMAANPLGNGLQSIAGAMGWGSGYYIPNTNDVQVESNGLVGGYSLRGEWLSPGSKPAVGVDTYWRGDAVYVPPAVIITLYPRYFTVETYTTGNRRQTYFFRNPDNIRLRDVRKILRYTGVQGQPPPPGFGTAVTDRFKFEGYPASKDGPDGIPGTADDTNYYVGDFVIYAEGNIRIRGVVGGRDPESQNYFERHLTVVSNGNIYIDGNLLRDNITTDDNSAGAAAVRGRSTIALLAKQYICVNTTQFLNPASQLYQAENKSGTAGDGPYPFRLGARSGNQTYLFNTNFAPILTPTGFQMPPYLIGTPNVPVPSLFLRHTADGPDGTSIYAFANYHNDPALGLTPNKIDFTPFQYVEGGLSDPFLLHLTAPFPTFYNDRFDIPLAYLYPNNLYPGGLLGVGQDNFMGVGIDAGKSVQDYFLTRYGVAPLDIRIEALMYAQEGSFFIIPGPWFNPDPNDTYENFVDNTQVERFGHRAQEVAATDPRFHTNPLFPFYQQPQDIRITFCGSINQNLPAEIADQGAWMEKWGWIPQFFGSTGLAAAPNYPVQGNTVPTVHGTGGALPGPNGTGNGIVYEFDDRAIAPYAPAYNGAPGAPLRPNPYNPTEPLPFAPRLPVAPGLLYYGRNTLQP